jgi:host factor-I protein
MEKSSQNLQDSFLNMARRDRIGITIYLMSGVKLTGRIRGFDKYSVIMESGQQQQLIFKHAISTVALPRGVNYRFDGSTEGEHAQGHGPQGQQGSQGSQGSQGPQGHGHAPSSTPAGSNSPAEPAPGGGGPRQGES